MNEIISDLFMTIFAGLVITAQIASSVFLIRNRAKFTEEIRIINLIHDLSNKDIQANKDYMWRYEEFESIGNSINTAMLLSFWIPVKSFYKDLDCLKEDRPQIEDDQVTV